MKTFDYRIPVLFILMCVMAVGFTYNKTEEHVPQENIPYYPQEFKENYRIDLKQDGYLIVDSHDGECYFVPFGHLEDWFLKRNL